MIVAALVLLQTGRVVRTIDVEGVGAVVASGPSGAFIAYKANFGRSKDAALRFDPSGKPLSEFDLPSPRALVGTDVEGAPVFYQRTSSLTRLRGEDVVGSVWQPDAGDLTVRGDWALRNDLDGLVVYRKASPIALVKDVRYDDAYGIDPVSGKVAVLRRRKRGLSLSRYEPSGKVRSTTLSDVGGRTVVEGFPLCSMEFLGRERILCVLGLSKRPSSGGKPKGGLFLCRVELRTGKVVSLAPIEAPQGDLPAPSRNRIAVLGRTVAVSSGGKLFFLHLS